VNLDRQKNKNFKNILLIGNPNVGKSVIFTELTGILAKSANFSGTTVSFMHGKIKFNGQNYNLVDVPGTYSLSASSKAETIAVEFLESNPKAIICVLDASNLERNLALALEIKKYNIPIIYTLNMLDVSKRHGIKINIEKLEKSLASLVIELIATRRKGFKNLINQLEVLLYKTPQCDKNFCNKCASCPFQTAREINKAASTKSSTNPNFLDKLGDAMVKPWPGVLIALFVMAATIGVVVIVGEILHEYVLDPLVDCAIVPFFQNIIGTIVPEGTFQNILIGEFGIFVISFEWILALIFPFVLMFYVAFTFLEDIGFLPRMAILFDGLMRKLGVQGGSLLHVLMGYGCAVPAIISTRAATSHKERIVVSAAICFAIPCISQTGALIALLGAYSWWLMAGMILFSIFLFITVILIIGKFVKGKVDPLLIEMPNLLLPTPRTYSRKLLSSIKHFLKDAQVPMMIAIVFAALLAESGILSTAANFSAPFVSGWLGLPAEAVTALILGIVRREMSVAPLLALNLTPLQAFVGGAVSLMYIPCISVFAILTREFKAKIAIIIFFATIISALIVGGLINHTARFFM